MNTPSKQEYLKLLCFFQLSFAFCLSAAPTDGWEQATPEEVLAKAQTISSQVEFIVATKDHLIDDQQRGFQFLQRKLSNGAIETKVITTKQGHQFSASYHLQSGNYFDADGLVRKIEYEEGPDMEIRIAKSMQHPYEYQFLKPTLVGTNDCFVVRRIMAQPMLDAVADECYSEKPLSQRKLLASKYIRSTTDFYIRKADGLILGCYKRNVSGGLLGDMLPDLVSVVDAIPSGQFSISNIDSAVKLTNFDEAADMMVRRIALKTGVSPDDNQTTKTRLLIVRCVLGIVTIVPIFILIISKLKSRKLIGG